MREQFPWFLDPTEEELQRLWEEATFCFDANVPLNLYRVDRETTEDYFKIFRELGDRIFLPHEAANQFFQNRRGVIRTEQNSFSAAKERVEEWVERRKVFNDIKDHLRGGDIGKIIEEEIENVFDDREDYEEEVEAVKEDLIERIEDLEERFTPTGTTRANAEEDEILGGLMDIFDGKTGSELEEDLEELKDEAQERYEVEKPPGYEDYDGEDEVSRGECEDFLIWKQLMDFAEREGEDVVFITGERKEDWWELDRQYNIIRPRHELLREFRSETGQNFWMLTTKQMLNSAYERMGIDVKEKSVEQTETISSRDMVLGRGIEYYMDEEEIKIQRIRESIGDIRKRCQQVIEIVKNMKNGINRDKKDVLHRYLALLGSSVESISDRYGRIEEAKSVAVEMNLGEMKESISRGEVEKAMELSENLESYIDDITEAMVNKIRELDSKEE